jgi:hypothetical protein
MTEHFNPVPRQTNRHDGWTAERQRNFVEALADTGSVAAAARAVGKTPESAYQLRRHPEAGEFRAAWEAALACGVQRLEDIAMDRALHGVESPVYSYGKLIGTRRVYNDALLMFLLRNRAGERFTADSWQSAEAATRSKLERLKREWRVEWEEEWHEQQRRESEEIILSINAKLDLMHERKRAAMSPRLLAAHDELARIQREEREAEWEEEDPDD